MRIICYECGSEFRSEGELEKSRAHCTKTASGCPLAHAEAVIERVDES